MRQSPTVRTPVSSSNRARPLAVAMDADQRLSRSESVLLLGAFLTLAASMVSFATL